MAEENFYFIKLTAKESATRTYVLVCLAVPENKSGVDRMDLVVSQNPETISIGVADSYRDCRNKIQKIILSGAVSQSATQSLSNYLRSSFTSESYMIELFHYLDHSEEDKLKTLLLQNVTRVLGKNEVEATIYLSKVTKTELEALSTSTKKEETVETIIPIPPSIPKDAKLVNYQFILSPVTGTSVNELKMGDIIMVKIIPDSDEVNNLIQSLNLKDDGGTIHPCAGTIVELIKHDHALETIVRINENIYGRYIEDELDLRIKMFETPSHVSEEEVAKTETPGSERNWFVPATIAFGILALLWIIVANFIL